MVEERPPTPLGHDRGEADELMALIDRLEALFERSELAELEVESSGTGVILRSPAALAPGLDRQAASALAASLGTTDPAAASPAGVETGESPAPDESLGLHAVLAPLTGIFYTAPAPDASPYLEPGSDVREGQVIGLIEAMKLFNEIKSDITGTVVRIAAENGTLVKAKQPLIEVEPA